MKPSPRLCFVFLRSSLFFILYSFRLQSLHHSRKIPEPAAMPWTERDDLTLLLLVLDLDISVSRDVFDAAAVKMGCRTDQCRWVFLRYPILVSFRRCLCCFLSTNICVSVLVSFPSPYLVLTNSEITHSQHTELKPRHARHFYRSTWLPAFGIRRQSRTFSL